MSTTVTNPPLSSEQTEAFGRELDAIRELVLADLGERDADYIRAVIRAQRGFEVAGRGLLLFSFIPPAWLGGVTALSLSKILDNMEVGHNVMHSQYDWMNDPALDGRRFEWDNACPGDHWRHSHNFMHHTYTNVLGKDRDVGYGILRMSEQQPWRPLLPRQPALRGAAGDLLPVRRRPARPRARSGPRGRGRAGREARGAERGPAQDSPADAQGLCPVPAAGGSRRAARARRQCDRQPRAQPVGVHDHLLRPLPRRRPVHRGADGAARPAASGTSASSSARPT